MSVLTGAAAFGKVTRVKLAGKIPVLPDPWKLR